MLIRSAKLVLVLALACSIGLHWFVLQSVAWTAMFADNLRQESLVDAVSRTFDGKHRCRLCQAIAAAKTPEKKSELAPQSGKLEFPPASRQTVPTAPAHFVLLAGTTASGPQLRFPPPTPPPRLFAA